MMLLCRLLAQAAIYFLGLLTCRLWWIIVPQSCSLRAPSRGVLMVEQDAAPAGRGMNAPPNPRAATGSARGTMTPRQELADGGPLQHAVTECAARRRQDAAMARREAPRAPATEGGNYPEYRAVSARRLLVFRGARGIGAYPAPAKQHGRCCTSETPPQKAPKRMRHFQFIVTGLSR